MKRTETSVVPLASETLPLRPPSPPLPPPSTDIRDVGTADPGCFSLGSKERTDDLLISGGTTLIRVESDGGYTKEECESLLRRRRQKRRLRESEVPAREDDGGPSITVFPAATTHRTTTTARRMPTAHTDSTEPLPALGSHGENKSESPTLLPSAREAEPSTALELPATPPHHDDLALQAFEMPRFYAFEPVSPVAREDAEEENDEEGGTAKDLGVSEELWEGLSATERKALAARRKAARGTTSTSNTNSLTNESSSKNPDVHGKVDVRQEVQGDTTTVIRIVSVAEDDSAANTMVRQREPDTPVGGRMCGGGDSSSGSMSLGVKGHSGPSSSGTGNMGSKTCDGSERIRPHSAPTLAHSEKEPQPIDDSPAATRDVFRDVLPSDTGHHHPPHAVSRSSTNSPDITFDASHTEYYNQSLYAGETNVVCAKGSPSSDDDNGDGDNDMDASKLGVSLGLWKGLSKEEKAALCKRRSEGGRRIPNIDAGRSPLDGPEEAAPIVLPVSLPVMSPIAKTLDGGSSPVADADDADDADDAGEVANNDEAAVEGTVGIAAMGGIVQDDVVVSGNGALHTLEEKDKSLEAPRAVIPRIEESPEDSAGVNSDRGTSTLSPPCDPAVDGGDSDTGMGAVDDPGMGIGGDVAPFTIDGIGEWPSGDVFDEFEEGQRRPLLWSKLNEAELEAVRRRRNIGSGEPNIGSGDSKWGEQGSPPLDTTDEGEVKHAAQTEEKKAAPSRDVGDATRRHGGEGKGKGLKLRRWSWAGGMHGAERDLGEGSHGGGLSTDAAGDDSLSSAAGEEEGGRHPHGRACVSIDAATSFMSAALPQCHKCLVLLRKTLQVFGGAGETDDGGGKEGHCGIESKQGGKIRGRSPREGNHPVTARRPTSFVPRDMEGGGDAEREPPLWSSVWSDAEKEALKRHRAAHGWTSKGVPPSSRGSPRGHSTRDRWDCAICTALLRRLEQDHREHAARWKKRRGGVGGHGLMASRSSHFCSYCPVCVRERTVYDHCF